jgi:hypothetical protein
VNETAEQVAEAIEGKKQRAFPLMTNLGGKKRDAIDEWRRAEQEAKKSMRKRKKNVRKGSPKKAKAEEKETRDINLQFFNVVVSDCDRFSFGILMFHFPRKKRLKFQSAPNPKPQERRHTKLLRNFSSFAFISVASGQS